MNESLLALVYEHEDLADLDESERRLALRELLAPHVNESELAPVVAEIDDEIEGYGILGPLIRMPGVTDVLVNAPDDVWIERAGRLERSAIVFDGSDHLYRSIERLAAAAHMRVDAAAPMADGRLPDGSRLNVVLPPISARGPLVSIRVFPRSRPSLDELAALETFDLDTKEVLGSAVRDRKNILIAGATGSGKTTLLGALLSEVDPCERVITIEETQELGSVSGSSISLLTRPSNVEGRGEITAEDLLRNALRMRPDRVVVGEARGPEAWVALQAMATGHRGSMLTIHAGTPLAALERLRALAEQAPSVSSTSIENHLGAIDLVVQMTRDGVARRASELLEVP